MSRIARGGLVLDFKTVDVHRAIRDCVEICFEETSAAGLEVILDLAASEHYVRGDRARLSQVVWNLVRNAARFSTGGGKLWIRTSNAAGARDKRGAVASAGRTGHGLIVEFTDTGIGIDPAMHDRVFEPFYQGDADVRRGPRGSGSGWRSAARSPRHTAGGWRLESSSPGQGSSFRLELGTVPADAMTHLNQSGRRQIRPAGRGLTSCSSRTTRKPCVISR